MDTEKSKKMPSAENYGFINSDNSSYPCSFNTYRTGFNFLLGEEFN